MKQLIVFLILSVLFTTGFGQAKFDSATVAKKVQAHLQTMQKVMPSALKVKQGAGSVESRVDFYAKDFDFKKANDAAYLQSKSRKVLVVKFADIKQSGCDIYVQTGVTRFPLSNLEIHADAGGKLLQELPYGDIQAAMNLLQNAPVITLRQAEEIFKAHAKSAGKYAYANLLIDLPLKIVKWQLRGVPNYNTQQQELIEIDAVSGALLFQQMKSMNVATSAISQ